jgi:hypothetical protein
MTQRDWSVLIDNFDNPRSRDEMVKAIAQVLWAGTPSPGFCRMLASIIDPDHPRAIGMPYVLKLQRPRQGGPKGPNWRVANEMERLVDIEGATIDVAMAEIQKKFGKKGNGRTACFNALAEARRFTELSVMVDAANAPKSSPD